MKMDRCMALVHINGYLRGNNTLVNTAEVPMKGMENAHMRAGMFIKDSGRMESLTEKEHSYVLTVNKLQEIGCKTKDTESIY